MMSFVDSANVVFFDLIDASGSCLHEGVNIIGALVEVAVASDAGRKRTFWHPLAESILALCREAFTMAEVQRVEIGTSALCDFFENSRIDASFSATGRRFNKHLVMILENLDRCCDRTLLNSGDLLAFDRGRVCQEMFLKYLGATEFILRYPHLSIAPKKLGCDLLERICHGRSSRSSRCRFGSLRSWNASAWFLADRTFFGIRSEERRVGKGCVRTCSSRWWRYT